MDVPIQKQTFQIVILSKLTFVFEHFRVFMNTCAYEHVSL